MFYPGACNSGTGVARPHTPDVPMALPSFHRRPLLWALFKHPSCMLKLKIEWAHLAAWLWLLKGQLLF
eukprot:11009979-Karenia_brevis.AAC.1